MAAMRRPWLRRASWPCAGSGRCRLPTLRAPGGSRHWRHWRPVHHHAARHHAASGSGIGGTGIVGVVTGFASVCLAGREVAFDGTVPVRVTATLP